MQAKGTEGIGSEYYGSSRDARRVGGGWEGLEEGGMGEWRDVGAWEGRGADAVGTIWPRLACWLINFRS